MISIECYKMVQPCNKSNRKDDSLLQVWDEERWYIDCGKPLSNTATKHMSLSKDWNRIKKFV